MKTKQKMKTKGGHWYWVVYSHVMMCVKATKANDGFLMAGREEVLPWDKAEVIYEAWPPRPKKQSTYEPKKGK